MSEHSTRAEIVSENFSTRTWGQLFTAVTVLVLVPLFVSASNVAAADDTDVILHESDGLWVMRQPWPEAAAWCKSGGGSPAAVVYDVYVYYDLPHENRMQLLGRSFEAFVADKLVPGIKELCGSGTDVGRIVLALYKKSDDIPPSAVVSDLSSSKTPPWDFLWFDIDGANVSITNYQAKDAQYHLSHAEVLALDPRTKAPVQASGPPTPFADYALYEGSGYRITSSFDRPGTAWCEHVYVPLLVTYQGSIETLDESVQPDWASFLQFQIVPQIKKICPSFPNANDLFRQTVRLEFYRAGESRIGSTMGLAFGDDGRLAWREGRQSRRQLAIAEAKRKEDARLAAEAEAEHERRALVAQREEEARRAAAAKPFRYEFFEVQCTDGLRGYIHTNTLVPRVKITTSRNLQESKAQTDEITECIESLSILLQASNPFASSVKYEVFDITGTAFAQSEFELTPRVKTAPLHQPEKLALFLGRWKTFFYDVEIRWDWGTQEFTGVVTSVTEKGKESGYAVGDVPIRGSLGARVYVDEGTTALLTTLRITTQSGSLESKGAIRIQLPYGDYMIFNDAEGSSYQLAFRLIERS